MHVSESSEAGLLANVEVLMARSAELLDRHAARKEAAEQHPSGMPHPFMRLPGVVLAVIEIDGLFRYVNRSFRSVLGYEGMSLKKYRFYDFIHPDDRATTRSTLARLGSMTEGIYLENRYRGGDNRYRWMGWSGVADFKSRLIHLVAHDLSAFRETEDALRRSEESLRAAQEVANIGSFDLNLQTRQIFWSQHLLRLLGMRAGQFDGRFESLIQCIHPDDRLAVQALATSAVRRGEVSSITFRVVRRDGAERILLGRGTTHYDTDGRAVRMVWTLQDVTERVLAERVLQLRESQLSLFIEHAPAAVAMFDTDLRYLAASQRWIKNNRLEAVEVHGRSHYDVISTMPAHWRDVHLRCLKGAIERCEEEWVVRGDGSADWLRWEIRPWYGADDAIGGLIMFSEIITEQKQAREMIERKRAELEAIYFGLPDAVIFTDPTRRIVMVNPAFLRIFGYDAREADGRTTAHLYVDGDPVDTAGPSPNGRPPGNEMHGGELWYRRKNGETFLGETVRMPVRDTEGRELGHMSIIRDITQRKEAEFRLKQAHAELLRTHKQLDAIINCTTDLIAAIDPELHYMAYNVAYEEEFEKIFGRAIERHVSVLDVLAHLPEEQAQAITSWERALQGETFVLTQEFGDHRRIRKTYETTYNAIRDEQDRIIGACLVARDVTERIRVERMKNEFISVVNHELRTPLTSITGSLALVMGGIAGPLSTETEKMIGVAHRNSERLVRLINDMLDLQKIEAGGLRLRMEHLDLEAFVAQALETNRGYADQFDVMLTYRAPEVPLYVRADADRLHQVIANLISNAVKFAPTQSTVEVGMVRADANQCRVYIKDSGPGIPEAFRPHVFKRFSQADSSTHRAREGTGLGLSICKSIIELHGGRIDFDTETGKGTTFYFELPEQEAHDDAHDPALPTAPPNRARILHSVLTEAGYLASPPAEE